MIGPHQLNEFLYLRTLKIRAAVPVVDELRDLCVQGFRHGGRIFVKDKALVFDTQTVILVVLNFLHRRADALGNILMADTLGCANLINRHPIHEIHPHPTELRIRQVLPNLRDLSDAAVDCLCPVMRLLHADIHGRNGGRFLG